MSANSLNLCQFIGHLGADPETKYTPSGTAIANMRLAVNYRRGEQEGTEWVSVVAFGKLAEICNEYLRKGSQVYIAGRMQTRKWQDRSGADRYTTEIIADQMQMLDRRAGDAAPPPAERQFYPPSAQKPPPGSKPQAVTDPEPFDDKIPF